MVSSSQLADPGLRFVALPAEAEVCAGSMLMGVASGWHGYGAAYLRLVQTYYLHLIISALLELKIYLKISVHL